MSTVNHRPDDVRDSYWVAYHQVQQRVVEVWSIGSVMYASTPSGDQYVGDRAAEILNALVQSDDVTLHRVPEAGGS